MQNAGFNMEKLTSLQVRISESDKESIELAAEICGISVSVWVRERLRKTARIELQSAGIKVPFLEDVGRK